MRSTRIRNSFTPGWWGRRDAGCATDLIQDLADRLASRVQLTSDGHKVCLNAVIDAFADDIDHAQLVKLYGQESAGQKHYSPAQGIGVRTESALGNPDPKHISTSCVERQNLTMRMSTRRFTRLINAFSTKVKNHAAAISLHYMHYNFCRIHQTLRVTPAMAAGISGHVSSVAKLIALLGQ
ncbi:MAG: hypothetical protein HYS04_22280 [Acidobacteria bacterium]|nr:hypothetical protein [Acidobacteriota bacterium]